MGEAATLTEKDLIEIRRLLWETGKFLASSSFHNPFSRRIPSRQNLSLRKVPLRTIAGDGTGRDFISVAGGERAPLSAFSRCFRFT